MFDNILAAVLGLIALAGTVLAWWMDNGPHNRMDDEKQKQHDKEQI